jgi:AcrR family transcriptional regulator
VPATRAQIGQQKRERTRATLIAAAMRVFARLGPDAPTIDHFVEEAGLAKGTFYNHFETRDELLIAVASIVSDQLISEMLRIRTLSDPAERVGRAVRTFVRKAVSDPTWGWIIVRIALIAAPLGEEMRENLSIDINDGLKQGRFQSPSLQAAYDLVLGLGLMGMRSVLRGDAGVDHAEHVAQLVLAALAVPDAKEVAYRPIGPAAT